jgi:hypothetical protein
MGGSRQQKRRRTQQQRGAQQQSWPNTNPTRPNTNLQPFLTLRAAPYGLGSLKLAQTEGIGKTATNLGINTNMLGRWKREHKLGIARARPTFTCKGNAALTEQEKENQQLRRELEIIEVWYNRERRHSSLGFLLTVLFEATHLTLF